MEDGDASRSLSSEIGPPLFPSTPNGKAAAGAAGGLLKTLFGVAPPNSHSAMVSRSSFKDLNFVGGEEGAQDAWRDKWEAHRRASLDEVKRLGGSSPGDGGVGGTSGTGGGVSRLGLPIPKAGEVYSVATGSGVRSPSTSPPHGVAGSSSPTSLTNGAAAISRLGIGARQTRPSSSDQSEASSTFGSSC